MLHHERLRPPPHDYPADEWNVIEKAFHPEFLAQLETMSGARQRISRHARVPGRKAAPTPRMALSSMGSMKRGRSSTEKMLMASQDRPDDLQRDRQQDHQALRG